MDTLETKAVSRDELVGRARALIPLIRARSDEAERNRRLVEYSAAVRAIATLSRASSISPS